MWGTKPRCAKLTGDSGSGFKAALIGNSRFYYLVCSTTTAISSNHCDNIGASAIGAARKLAGKFHFEIWRLV